MSFLLRRNSSQEQFDTTSGGKAKNLHALHCAGFRVPTWAVINTRALEAVLEALSVRPVPHTAPLEQQLADAEHIRSILIQDELPAEIHDVIREAYQEVGCGNTAVRSSGRDEDGAQHSFAGVFDTVLNVADPRAVESAVRQCWASAFSERAVAYRHARNLPFSPLAVIVQRLVEPECSGVMFTANPATGARGELVISSVFGLGEGLVSGAIDADTVILDKITGTPVKETIADKIGMTVSIAAGGVEIVEVPAERQNTLSLRKATQTDLFSLGLDLERHFGAPQDVEWAENKEGLWILQTRPITTLVSEGESEVLQLGEIVGPTERRIWDNSNIIENFNGVTSPLTFTTARAIYAEVYRGYARSMRVPKTQRKQMESWLPVMLGHFHGHVYYNIQHWYRMVGIAPGYSLNRRVLEMALGMAHPLDPVLAETLHPFTFRTSLTKALSRAVTTATFLWHFLTLDRKVTQFSAAFDDFFSKNKRADLVKIQGSQAYQQQLQVQQDISRLWGPVMILDALLLTTVGILSKMTKAFMPDAPQWLGYAVVNPGQDAVSLAPARALSDIATFIRESSELATFLEDIAPENSYAHLVEHAEKHAGIWEELRKKTDNYIDRFGYRGLDELKLESPDLHEDPSGVFYMLRMAAPKDSRGGEEEVQTYLDAHLTGPRRWVFDALRHRIRRWASHRELLRFSRTQAFGVLKTLTRAIGRDLEQRGIIVSASDVFFLRSDELHEIYHNLGNDFSLRPMISRRKTAHESDTLLKAPAQFTTIGSEYTENELAVAGWGTASPQLPAASGAVLTGTPSSPGVVTDRAVVVEKPEDFSGGILVALRTDPGWVAALPFASALLIERASPLTHVAIIARELGVPTVVQINDLTHRIHTGMTLRVDGAKGDVVIVDEILSEETHDAE